MKARTKFSPAAFLARYDAMDRALVAAGFPPTSPWWRRELERFVRSRRRRWVVRAGRRSGKSSGGCRFAIAWSRWGTWSVPPGDRAVVAFVSVDRDEASARLRTIADILRTLGILFDERGDEIELRDRPVVFKVITASITKVGFTSILLFCDEVARWESRDDKVNPAREVLASLRPTTATQPHAFEVLASSPWGTDDFHAELFEKGDDEQQVTSFAPTWVANPSITERRTHELEPDPKTWAREYAAIPGVTLTAALDPSDVAACFGREPDGVVARPFLAIDASSLRGDAFAWVAGHETNDDEIVVTEAGGWSGDELKHVTMADIVASITQKAKSIGTAVVFGDQREEASLTSLFAQHGVTLETFAWSEPSKDDAVMLLRRLMRERLVLLCDHETLRRELTTMRARLLPSGRTRYETNGLDYASALVTLMHAHLAGHVGQDEVLEAIRAVNRSTHSVRKSAFVPGFEPLSGTGVMYSDGTNVRIGHPPNARAALGFLDGRRGGRETIGEKLRRSGF